MSTISDSHGEQRVGLLTSSVASIIMHGNAEAWASYRDRLWAEDGTEFDNQVKTGARAYGHEHEAEGAAKFWDRHPEFELQAGGFFMYRAEGSPLDQWLGSSPDRIVLNAWNNQLVAGLEVKSPTSAEKFEEHGVRKHFDQCQHGMLVTNIREWYLVVHHGDLYKDFHLTPDKDWQARYIQRATQFLAYCYEDKPVKRRKLSIHDLGI